VTTNREAHGTTEQGKQLADENPVPASRFIRLFMPRSVMVMTTDSESSPRPAPGSIHKPHARSPDPTLSREHDGQNQHTQKRMQRDGDDCQKGENR